MSNISTKTTIGVIKHNVKELLGMTDTALVKKWAFLASVREVGHELEVQLAVGTESLCLYGFIKVIVACAVWVHSNLWAIAA